MGTGAQVCSPNTCYEPLRELSNTAQTRQNLGLYNRLECGMRMGLVCDRRIGPFFIINTVVYDEWFVMYGTALCVSGPVEICSMCCPPDAGSRTGSSPRSRLARCRREQLAQLW